jgi:hypothetical protein
VEIEGGGKADKVHFQNAGVRRGPGPETSDHASAKIGKTRLSSMYHHCFDQRALCVDLAAFFFELSMLSGFTYLKAAALQLFLGVFL